VAVRRLEHHARGRLPNPHDTWWWAGALSIAADAAAKD
jgi:hypothetical protein